MLLHALRHIVGTVQEKATDDLFAALHLDETVPILV